MTADLTKVLTAHVVPSKLSATRPAILAKASCDYYNFNAVSGDALTALVKGRNLYVIKEHGSAEGHDR